ncbi:signal transduction histidine kinase [Halomicronema hongdechloris C2206]|uniref:histidine kinase n=1 Tax=Halomicronema hongdechloris C2206 TaxID=1641165 RepID=A0A1Z3HJ17_9CYAN|nr:hybrid sensor histidine kinase/response regulator [Halomicronema hongdechloris]ASC70256.1 signal transduction histidine kinase [Halomicronema hongdechloris C2206]
MPSLLQFLSCAPSCHQLTSLATVVEQLGTGQHDVIVVLEHPAFPIGLIRAGRLMAYVLSHLSNEAVYHGASTAASMSVAQLTQHSSELSARLTQTLVMDCKELVESVAVIPHHWSLAEFWTSLADGDASHWAVVDAQQTYLGLIECRRLLPFLRWPWNQTPPALAPRTPALPSQTGPFQEWLTLLDAVPMPLMLQWGTEQSSFFNLTWRSRLGADFMPTGLTQNLVPPSCDTRLLAATPSLSNDNQQILQHLSGLPGRWQYLPPTDYPLGDGSWQRWAFLKLPLSFANGLDRALSGSTQSLSGDELRDSWLVIAYQPLAETDPQTQGIVDADDADWLVGLGHDLKTPLTSLLGLSNLLQNQRLGTLTDKQRRYVDLIHRNARELMTLVDQMSDWMRLSRGQLALNSEWLNLETLCQQVLVPRLDAQESWTEYVTVAGSEADPRERLSQHRIFADPSRLHQMLDHLIDNAQRHTPSDTPWGMRIERWGSWLGLIVWDRGEGIAINEQSHLLTTPAMAQGGTGLGLPLTRQLARLHGGDLSFVSYPHQGSEFTLLLPAPALTQPPGQPVLEPMTRLLVLAAVDPVLIKAVTEGVRSSSYRVVVARSWPEAQDMVSRLQPEALLLQWQGLGMADRQHSLMAMSQAQPCAMIALTPHPPEETAAEVLSGWIPTPVAIAELPIHLNTLLFPTPQPEVLRQRTVLLLRPEPSFADSSKPDGLNLSSWLHRYQCRVLEVDDLEQASLISRVWHPDVMLLDPDIPDVAAYLQALSQQDRLLRIPLITLSNDATQAANHYVQLMVFPCLIKGALDQAGLQETTANTLMQVMAVAIDAHDSA